MMLMSQANLFLDKIFYMKNYLDVGGAGCFRLVLILPNTLCVSGGRENPFRSCDKPEHLSTFIIYQPCLTTAFTAAINGPLHSSLLYLERKLCLWNGMFAIIETFLNTFDNYSCLYHCKFTSCIASMQRHSYF